MFHDFGLLNGKIFRFLRIAHVVVELELSAVRRGTRLFPFNKAVALSTNGSAEGLLGKAMEGMVTDSGLWIFEHRNKATAVNTLRAVGRGEISKFREGGKEVHRLGKLECAAIGLDDAWSADEERDAVGLLVVGVLCPDAVIAEMKAMVAPENNQSGISEYQSVELIDDLTDLSIDKAGAGIITLDQLAFQFRGESRIVLRHGFVGSNLTTMLMRHLGRARRVFLQGGHRQLLRIVHVPVFLRGRER